MRGRRPRRLRLAGLAAALVRVGWWRAVAAGAEAGDARLQRANGPLDAPHLLLEGGERGHALDRTAHRLVDHMLELPEALGHLRELLHAAPGAFGHRADRLHAAIDGGGESLQGRLAVLDDLAQHAQRQQPALPPLLLENDLREGDGGQVLAGVVLEDLHVLAGLHPTPDLVERHVTALARVVELAVAVALDESAHGSAFGYHTFARAHK